VQLFFGWEATTSPGGGFSACSLSNNLFFTLSLVATVAVDATFFFVAWMLVMMACRPTSGGVAGDDDAVARCYRSRRPGLPTRRRRRLGG